MRKATNKNQIVSELKTLAIQLGKTPSASEFDEWASVCTSRTVQKRFGSWNDAILAAGLKPNLVCIGGAMGGKRMDEAKAIEQIREMAERIGKTPSMLEFDGQPGHYSSKTIVKHFGSWTAAVLAAGLEPNTNHWK